MYTYDAEPLKQSIWAPTKNGKTAVIPAEPL